MGEWRAVLPGAVCPARRISTGSGRGRSAGGPVGNGQAGADMRLAQHVAGNCEGAAAAGVGGDEDAIPAQKRDGDSVPGGGAANDVGDGGRARGAFCAVEGGGGVQDVVQGVDEVAMRRRARISDGGRAGAARKYMACDLEVGAGV